MRILGIGESVIDKSYITEGTNVPDDSVPTTHVGGPVLISMILLARLGHETTFVTTLGQDKEGDFALKTLYQEHVYVFGEFKEQTKVNDILIHPTTGQRIKLRGNVTHPAIEHMEPEVIRHFDIFVIDRHHKEAFFEIVKHKKPSAKIIIDPSTEVSSFTQTMIKYADYPIVPIEALTKIAGEHLHDALEHLYKLARKTVVVTAGELGSIIFDGQTMKLIPAFSVKTVDTTGAGDIYRGAFAYGLIQQWSIQRCVEYANCVAALHCTKFGNADAIPSKYEINQFLAQSENKKSLTEPAINNYFDRL
jgi:sugar/nucleoside kinase (ribokinase family)